MISKYKNKIKFTYFRSIYDLAQNFGKIKMKEFSTPVYTTSKSNFYIQGIIDHIALINKLYTQTEKDREIIINLILAQSIKNSSNVYQIANNHELVGNKYYGYVDTMVVRINNEYIISKFENICLVVEAKKDNFEFGEVQVLTELITAYENNKNSKHVIGIVTNLSFWYFYKYCEDSSQSIFMKSKPLILDFKSNDINSNQLLSIIYSINYLINTSNKF